MSRTRRDITRQALLLGPGVGLTTIAIISLLREATAIGWVVLIVGLALLVLFGALQLRTPAR